jgi:hypothetical protein
MEKVQNLKNSKTLLCSSFVTFFGFVLVTNVHLFILGCASWQWNPADVL